MITPLETAIALACIISPQPIDVLPCSPMTIQSVALSMEMMDRNECKYLFTRKEDIAVDSKLIHKRYAELKYAPYASDADRWPDRERVREWIGQSRMYVAWLEERKLLFRDDWINEAIADAECSQRILELISDAKCGYYYITVRRKALADLREAIGPHAYYAGALPAVVPVWYFRRIDD